MKHTMAVLLAFSLGTGMALGGGNHDSHGHDNGSADHHGHQTVAPHGGTIVVIAEHAIHLELVADEEAGTMTAYIYDGHLAALVPVSESSFVINTKVAGKPEALEFNRVADGGGELAPEQLSAEFKATAEWLKSVKEFHADLKSITLNGEVYTGIHFAYPSGEQHSH